MTYASYPPYTLLAKASQIRERIAFVIEGLAPELAPTITFQRLVKWPAITDSNALLDKGEPGYQPLEQTTSVARWRMFYVRCTAWSRGDNADSIEGVNQAVRVEVMIGVPEESILKYDPDDPTTVYDTEDIIAHDEEQLVDELSHTGIFVAGYNGEPAIEGVDNIEFLGASRSPRVLSLVFLVRYERRR